jgi:glycine/D-amino acid oxidase-like deaminating enzyme
MGLALAPITGRLVREIIGEEEPSHDLHAVRPDRFRPLI